MVTNISVSLNVNVTNNLQTGDFTDAVLIINGNHCIDPVFAGGLGIGDAAASCDGSVAPDERFQDPQFGELVATDRVEWDGIHFPVPGGPSEPWDGTADSDGPAAADCHTDTFDSRGATASKCNPSRTVVRISSIRGNASELGVPSGASVFSTQIQALITVTGPDVFGISQNVLNVAIPLVGLLVNIDEDDAVSGLQCDGEHLEFTFKIQEGFATAFKTLGLPTFARTGNTQVEAGYFAPDSLESGGASQSTQFRARFFNIPEGVDVAVEKAPDCFDFNDDPEPVPDDSDLLEIAVVDCDENEDDTSICDVDIDVGFGEVVYEVLKADPIAREDCEIDVWFIYDADTSNDLPAPGTGQLAVTFDPLSTEFFAEVGEDVPRFIDTGGDPTNVITIVRCTTQILFPFVTNVSGFDTGLVVSNTSEDWLDTDPQDGTCTVHYHGATLGDGASPPPDTSSVIGAGEQLVWLLSAGNAAQEIDPAADFQGYVIVVCDFQYAHGYAYITDGFGVDTKAAQGYLALIIPVDADGRMADPGAAGGSGSGEGLNQ